MSRQLLTEAFYRNCIIKNLESPDVHLFVQFLPDQGTRDLSHWNRTIMLEGGLLYETVYKNTLYKMPGYLLARDSLPTSSKAILRTSLAPGLNLNNFSIELWMFPVKYETTYHAIANWTFKLLTHSGYIQFLLTTTLKESRYSQYHIQIDINGETLSENLLFYTYEGTQSQFCRLLITGFDGNLYVYINNCDSISAVRPKWIKTPIAELSLETEPFQETAQNLEFILDETLVTGIRILNEKCLLKGAWDDSTNAYPPTARLYTGTEVD
ncbi:MAG: hypothetical protein Q4E67_00605 [Planctomycetia bacterium]|nr:hypothetical protein [Planctomycetia bacterium]